MLGDERLIGAEAAREDENIFVEKHRRPIRFEHALYDEIFRRDRAAGWIEDDGVKSMRGQRAAPLRFVHQQRKIIVGKKGAG